VRPPVALANRLESRLAQPNQFAESIQETARDLLRPDERGNISVVGQLKHEITEKQAKAALEIYARYVTAELPEGERPVRWGVPFKTFAPILEMICRAYNPGWLLLARWHMEMRSPVGYENAKEELRRFLENDATSEEASEAWLLLGHACYQTGDELGEVRSQINPRPIAPT
jgi:hypothetical protein